VKELKDVLGMVADGLKSFAEGMGMIAGKVDALAQSLGDTETAPPAPKQKAAKTRTEKVKKTPAKKPVVKEAAKQPAKKTAPKAAPEKKEAVTASSRVLEVISDSGNGLDTSAIMKKTGFDKKKVSNILHRLKQQNKIENSKRGLYSKKG
jgi:uncharacterized membrane protein